MPSKPKPAGNNSHEKLARVLSAGKMDFRTLLFDAAAKYAPQMTVREIVYLENRYKTDPDSFPIPFCVNRYMTDLIQANQAKFLCRKPGNANDKGVGTPVHTRDFGQRKTASR